MQTILSDLKNRIDFFLRNRLVFSRKNYSETFEHTQFVTDNQEQKDLFDYLEKKYGLKTDCGLKQKTLLENIYCLNLFDKYFSKHNQTEISVLDIGSKNWSYVKSEYLFFTSLCKKLILDGIELDAYRVCTNLYNRYELAKYYSKVLKGTSYISGDFLKHAKKYDYIIWILPFVTEYPLTRWGLPLKYFKPAEMLKHAYDSLKSNGEMLIVNQGEYEYGVQKQLNKSLNITAEYYGEIEDVFNIFKNKRYCTKITKT